MADLQEAGVSTDEIADVVGLTSRQIDHWVRQGYLPSINSQGSGRYRRYDLNDVVEVAMLAALVRVGFRPGSAAVLLKAVGR